MRLILATTIFILSCANQNGLMNGNCEFNPDTGQCDCIGSPIIFDLEGDGIHLTTCTNIADVVECIHTRLAPLRLTGMQDRICHPLQEVQMGNENTEKKKLHKRKVRAREFLKTRTWRSLFGDLTPLDHEEVLLVYDLVFPGGRGFRFHYEYGHEKISGSRKS